MEAIEHLLQTLAVLSTLSNASPAAPQHFADDPNEPLARVFVNREKQCSWAVINNTDGLHIVVNGGLHCPRLTFIDGRRLSPERRAGGDGVEVEVPA